MMKFIWTFLLALSAVGFLMFWGWTIDKIRRKRDELWVLGRNPIWCLLIPLISAFSVLYAPNFSPESSHANFALVCLVLYSVSNLALFMAVAFINATICAGKKTWELFWDFFLPWVGSWFLDTDED